MILERESYLPTIWQYFPLSFLSMGNKILMFGCTLVYNKLNFFFLHLLLRSHYKEYLVNLINRNKVDPVYIMDVSEMIRLIEREEKTPPQRKPTYQESQYRKKLIQVSDHKSCLRETFDILLKIMEKHDSSLLDQHTYMYYPHFLISI